MTKPLILVAIASAHRWPAGWRRRQGHNALMRVILVRAKVLLHQGLDEHTPFLAQGAVIQQDLPQRLDFINQPSSHGGDQRLLVDEVVLKGQDAKQQIAVGRAGPRAGGVGHGADSQAEEPGQF